MKMYKIQVVLSTNNMIWDIRRYTSNNIKAKSGKTTMKISPRKSFFPVYLVIYSHDIQYDSREENNIRAGLADTEEYSSLISLADRSTLFKKMEGIGLDQGSANFL